MILHMLMLAGQFTASQPTISGVTVSTQTAGACAGPGNIATNATIQIAWTLANSDPATYSIKIYENGALLTTIAGDSTFYNKGITGAVESGPSAPWTSNWTYRVDVVRNSDSVAVASATSAAWVKLYGGC